MPKMVRDVIGPSSFSVLLLQRVARVSLFLFVRHSNSFKVIRFVR